MRSVAQRKRRGEASKQVQGAKDLAEAGASARDKAREGLDRAKAAERDRRSKAGGHCRVEGDTIEGTRRRLRSATRQLRVERSLDAASGDGATTRRGRVRRREPAPGG